MVSLAVMYNNCNDYTLDELIEATKACSNIDAATEYYWPPLLSAARFYYIPKMATCFELLLDLGANCNILYGWTPLTLLLYNCPVYHAVKRLIDCGANVNLQDSDGNTPLMSFLTSQVNRDILTLLLDLGADCNIKNKTHQHALIIAIITNKPIDIIELLVTRTIDIDICLMYCCQVRHNCEKIIQLLLDYGVKYNLADIIEFSCGCNNNIQILINLGNVQDTCTCKKRNGWSALMCAVYYDNLQLVDELLKVGADINYQIDGVSALIIAIKKHQNLILPLLDRGADKWILYKGITAMEYYTHLHSDIFALGKILEIV